MIDNKNDNKEFYQRLKQLLQEDKTQEEILKILIEEYHEKLPEDFIDGAIQHFLSDKSAAEKYDSYQTSFNEFFGESDNKKHAPPSGGGKSPAKNLVTLSKRFDDLYNLITEINSNLKLTNKRIASLETKTGKLEEFIREFDKNNPYEKINIRSDEMIKIYASERNKKSVNINTEVNQKIMDIIYKKYGIENNNSLAVNTALLLALYKSGLENMQDFEKEDESEPSNKTNTSKSYKRKSSKTK